MARRAAFICGIIVALGYAWWAQQQWQLLQPNTAEIQLLNVGQGDAIHIRTLAGTDLLIDGGPDAMVVERLGEELPFWDRNIELMALSHPDADHITGLIAVFEYYTVDQLVLVDLPVTKPLHKELIQRAQAQGTEIVYLRAGATVQLSAQETIQVLYPFITTKVAMLPTNDASFVMLYTFTRDNNKPSTTMLMSGDAADTVEDQLVRAGVVPDVDILKVGHHGSASSSSTAYVAAAQAKYAAISVAADNDYGHPTAAALERLATTSQIVRTDQLGTITFQINDNGYLLDN